MEKSFESGKDVPFSLRVKDVDCHQSAEWMYVTKIYDDGGVDASGDKSEGLIFTKKDLPEIKRAIVYELQRLTLPVKKDGSLSFVGFELEEIK
jgi:hypothetical protein